MCARYDVVLDGHKQLVKEDPLILPIVVGHAALVNYLYKKYQNEDFDSAIFCSANKLVLDEKIDDWKVEYLNKRMYSS